MAATRSSTRRPSRTTSGPMPSPGMTAMRLVAMVSFAMLPANGPERSGMRVDHVLDRDPRAYGVSEPRRRSESPRQGAVHHSSHDHGGEAIGTQVGKVAQRRPAALVD